MLSRFQASYARLEASLQKLTDSITAYNPSITATEELLQADEAVNNHVETLIIHQKNNLRLQALRRTSDALDEQIKSTIRLLADTRREIQRIPSVETADDDAEGEAPRPNVHIDDLLSYARFISKTTVPPTQLLQRQKQKPTAAAMAAESQQDVRMTNGIATPPSPETNNNASSNPAYVLEDGGRAVKELEWKDKEWLMPGRLAFDPWPSGEMMRRGVMGKIQSMLEQGIDPSTVLSEEEKAAEAERKRIEEEQERVEQEARERRAREEMGYVARRNTVEEERPFDPDLL